VQCTINVGGRTDLRLRRTAMVHAHAPTQGTNMDMNNFFTDLQGKINQAIESSPAKDIEKNVKAMMTQGFSKLDLVTREEFDIQAQVLAKTRAKLEALELRMTELELRATEQAAAK
jgi:BMFP domain-containing protein YqiC